MTGTSATQRWLFGPLPDLLFGCGLVYALAFVGLALAGPSMRAVMPLELTPLVLLVTGIPHYGATLVRVYGDPADRRRYAVFGVWLTALVWIAFAVGVYEFAVGSFLLTLYLTWSPWHYSSQNYGIATMFLRRRGVNVGARCRKLLQASFALSFALTFVALHGDRADVAYAPADYLRSVYHVLPLGIPYGAVRVLVPVLLAAYLAALLGAVVALRRAAHWRELLPALLLIGSQALWFTIPMIARHANVLQGVEPLGTDQATYAFLWVAVAHSVQYVWITSYYARRSPDHRGSARYLAGTLLAGAAIWVVPSLVFAPGVLGTVPYDAGLGVLVAAAVNLHHFVLDGAIWKLRDGRIAKVLLRGEGETAPRARPAPLLTWPMRAVGAAAVLVLAVSPVQQLLGAEAAKRGDLASVETSLRRLQWLGRESALSQVTMALMLQSRGNMERAMQHVEAAQRLHPDYAALGNLGVFYAQAEMWDEAIDALRRAHREQPASAKIANQLAQLLITREGLNPESVQTAIALAEQAVRSTGETNGKYLRTLAVAYAAAGRLDDALRTAELGRARAADDPDLIEWFTVKADQYRQAMAPAKH